VSEGDYITKCFMICTAYQILFGLSHQEEGDRLGMWHERQTGDLHIALAGKHEVKTPFGRPRCRKHNVKMDLQEEIWRRHGLDWSGRG
jgi:hypothetical protein